MFPSPYYSSRYFPARYWPKYGTQVVEESPSTTFEVRERRSAFGFERRGAAFERSVDREVFTTKARGTAFETPPRGTVYLVEEN